MYDMGPGTLLASLDIGAGRVIGTVLELAVETNRNLYPRDAVWLHLTISV
jgi:hypothetical protein